MPTEVPTALGTLLLTVLDAEGVLAPRAERRRPIIVAPGVLVVLAVPMFRQAVRFLAASGRRGTVLLPDVPHRVVLVLFVPSNLVLQRGLRWWFIRRQRRGIHNHSLLAKRDDANQIRQVTFLVLRFIII